MSATLDTNLAAAVAAGLTAVGNPAVVSLANGLTSADGSVQMYVNNSGQIVNSAGTAPAVATLTDGATVTWDWAAGPLGANYAQVTLAGNRTLAITNPTIGERGVLKVIQDGTGSRTLTYPTTTLKVATPLTTTASAADLLVFEYVGANLFWMVTDTKGVS